MTAKILVVVLCGALVGAPLMAQKNPQGPTIKEQVILVSAGALVEVKLKDKRRFRGRMGTVTDEFFVIQHAINDKVIDEKIAFADVKSVNPKEQGMSTGVKVGLGAAAGAGALFLASFILYLVYSD
jgi:hypothetical protein